MAFCHIDGARVYYESEGEGPPIVLVHGAGDFLVTRDIVKEMAQRIRNSRVTILEGVGHFPHTEALERFNEEVGRFLSSL